MRILAPYAVFFLSSLMIAALACHTELSHASVTLLSSKLLSRGIAFVLLLEYVVWVVAPFLLASGICATIWVHTRPQVAIAAFVVGEALMLAMYRTIGAAIADPRTGPTAVTLAGAARLVYTVPILLGLSVTLLVVSKNND